MAKTKLNDNQKSDTIDLDAEVVDVLQIANGGTGLNSVSGQNDKFIKVNATGTGLEFGDAGISIVTTDPVAPAVDTVWIKKEIGEVGMRTRIFSGLMTTYPVATTILAKLKLQTEQTQLTTIIN